MQRGREKQLHRAGSSRRSPAVARRVKAEFEPSGAGAKGAPMLLSPSVQRKWILSVVRSRVEAGVGGGNEFQES